MALAAKTFEDCYCESVEYTDPGFTAIDLSLAKTFARIDGDDDDAVVTFLLDSAQEAFKDYTQSPLYQGEVVAKFSGGTGNIRFQLPLKPVISIESVQQDEEDIDYTQEGNWIIIDSFDSENGLVTITYTAGLLEENDDVPQRIKEGLLNYILSNYDDREDVSAMGVFEMPNGSESKWQPYKYVRL